MLFVLFLETDIGLGILPESRGENQRDRKQAQEGHREPQEGEENSSGGCGGTLQGKIDDKQII